MTFAPLDQLIASLPDGTVIADPDRMAGYRWDRANDPDAGLPLAVIRATSTEDGQVVGAVRGRTQDRGIPRGTGSRLSGGSSAVDGCLVVSLDRMRTITVDPTTRTVVTEPGASNAEVKAAAAQHGLWYPPGSLLIRGLLNRWVRGDQRRKSVLRQVERHD